MLAELGGEHGRVVESELDVVGVRGRGVVGQIPGLGERVEFPGGFRVGGEVGPGARREGGEHLFEEVVVGRGIEMGVRKLNLRRVRDLVMMLLLLLLLLLVVMMTVLEVLKGDLGRAEERVDGLHFSTTRLHSRRLSLQTQRDSRERERKRDVELGGSLRF